MNKSILYVLIAIGFIIFKANAQTGVYYFDSAVKTNAQARVVDIEEAGSGKLVLINNVSDENYMNPIMQFLVISNKGTIELNKGIPVNNLYDLNSIKKIN